MAKSDKRVMDTLSERDMTRIHLSVSRLPGFSTRVSSVEGSIRNILPTRLSAWVSNCNIWRDRFFDGLITSAVEVPMSAADLSTVTHDRLSLGGIFTNSPFYRKEPLRVPPRPTRWRNAVI